MAISSSRGQQKEMQKFFRKLEKGQWWNKSGKLNEITTDAFINHYTYRGSITAANVSGIITATLAGTKINLFVLLRTWISCWYSRAIVVHVWEIWWRGTRLRPILVAAPGCLGASASITVSSLYPWSFVFKFIQEHQKSRAAAKHLKIRNYLYCRVVVRWSFEKTGLIGEFLLLSHHLPLLWSAVKYEN